VRSGVVIVAGAALMALVSPLASCASPGAKSKEGAAELPPANPSGMSPDEENLRQIQRERAAQRPNVR